MNRKSFLKALVGGAAAAVVLPSALSSCEPVPVDPKRLIAIDASRIPQGVSIEDTVKHWQKTGELVYEFPINAKIAKTLVKKYGRGMGLHELLTSIS